MSWTEWGYPDNLDTKSLWRCLYPLYLAMTERNLSAKGGDYLMFPDRYERFTNKYGNDISRSEYAMKLIRRIDEFILSDTEYRPYDFIKPDFSGNFFVEDPDYSSGFAVNKDIEIDLSKWEELIHEPVISANDVNHGNLLVPWMLQRYKMINCLTRRLKTQSVCLFVGREGRCPEWNEPNTTDPLEEVYSKAIDNAHEEIGLASDNFCRATKIIPGEVAYSYQSVGVRWGDVYAFLDDNNYNDQYGHLEVIMKRPGWNLSERNQGEFYNPGFAEGLNQFELPSPPTKTIELPNHSDPYVVFNINLSSGNVPPLPSMKETSERTLNGECGFLITIFGFDYYKKYKFVPPVDNT